MIMENWTIKSPPLQSNKVDLKENLNCLTQLHIQGNVMQVKGK